MNTIEDSLNSIANKYNYKDWDALEFDLDLSIITPMIKEAMIEYAYQFRQLQQPSEEHKTVVDLDKVIVKHPIMIYEHKSKP